MRTLLSLAAGLLLLSAVPAAAQDNPSPVAYSIDVVPGSVFSRIAEKDGKQARFVSLQFHVRRLRDKAAVTSIPPKEIVVEEDGRPVLNLEIFQPKAQDLTTVLVMDVSGSMERNDKMKKAKEAALAFLDKMDERAAVGLILFDHEVKASEPPVLDDARKAAHRERLRQLIRDARPQGGTAYHDATIRAVSMLRGIKGRRAVVLMTDGADTNSKRTLAEAIESAQQGEVPVYTLGIGAPGKNDPVTTVLVLDRSGSMLGKADEKDDLKKIDALKRAANRFVALMRRGAKTTLLPFSSEVDKPEPFTDDQAVLRLRIGALKAFGGTLLYDATFAGIETLEAGNVKGKKAVVVLTDGQDEAPGSRRSDDEVIARAQEVGVPVYMLGLGRPDKGEINELVMQKIAGKTMGRYYRASSQKELLEVFENLSIELHDDGIDEESLRKLASETGGRYTHVSKLSELQFIYEKLADELQTTYKAMFESRRSSHDGTARGIDVKIVDAAGRVRSTVGKADDVARGVVVPQMSYGVYLVFLGVLAGLLALPGLLSRVFRPATAEA
jgi:VWFA-related protein